MYSNGDAMHWNPKLRQSLSALVTRLIMHQSKNLSLPQPTLDWKPRFSTWLFGDRWAFIMWPWPLTSWP